MASIIGIDYSMTSPAICFHTGDEWDIKNCVFHYFDKKPGNLIVDDVTFCSTEHIRDWSNDQERYSNLALWVIGLIQEHLSLLGKEYCSIIIENYAYAGTGRTFHIGENTGTLKHLLWKSGIQFKTITPTEVKKFAAGKGNANKQLLEDTFKEETGIDMSTWFGQKDNPKSDIIDSYYIAKHSWFSSFDR